MCQLHLELHLRIFSKNIHLNAAIPILTGDQLENNRSANTKFTRRRVAEDMYIFELETRPSLAIGIGQLTGKYNIGEEERYTCVLVEKTDGRALLREVGPRNGGEGFSSYEAAGFPGLLLNHCDGKMWFFDTPANSEYIFSQDASWRLIRQMEQVQREGIFSP